MGSVYDNDEVMAKLGREMMDMVANQKNKFTYNPASLGGSLINAIEQYLDEDEPEEEDDYEPDGSDRDDDDDGPHFADPGGGSALRAATPDNPRNLPCPRCEEPNRLTPEDRAQGYVCDRCAGIAEGRIVE